MSLWSGATQYVRVPNTRKEMWMPAEFSIEMELYIWKVKHDPESGRYFFVNLAGFGKRWRLPDIYDQTSQVEFKQYVNQTGKGHIVNLSATRGGDRSQHGSHRQNGSSAGHQSSRGGTGSQLSKSSTNAGVVEMYNNNPPPPPPPVTKSSAIEDGIKEMQSKKYHQQLLEEAQLQHVQNTTTAVPAGADLAFGYDDDDGWKGMITITTPPPAAAGDDGGTTTTPAAAPGGVEPSVSDVLRRAQIEEERRAMVRASEHQEQQDPQEGDAAAAHPPISGGGMLDIGVVDVEAFKELQAQEALVDALYQEKHYESQVREASMQRSAMVFDQQMHQLDQRYLHDLEDIDHIERTHSNRIRQESEGRTHTPSPNQHTPATTTGGNHEDMMSPTVYSPPPRILASSPSDGLGSVPIPSSVAVTDSMALISASHHQQQTVSLALSQVEHERKTNERLMKELDEKDRLLAEYRLSDAEREQSMLQLRMQLLDAMVANRRKLEMMTEEDGLALPGHYNAPTGSPPHAQMHPGDASSPNPSNQYQQHQQQQQQQQAGSQGRGKSGSYVPPHPLMQDDDGYTY